MAKIHPTAIVSARAELSENVEVGPFAIIHDDVKIGNGTVIGPHAVIYDGARIGERVKIFQGASVSNVPQDLKFDNEYSEFFIDDDTVIREFVTLHRGTKETGFTKIGKNCLIMAYSHIAHDCVLGNHIIMANSCQLAGHVVIDDYVTLGGNVLIPQFLRIGRNVMLGAGIKVTTNVPPYVLAAGDPPRFSGLNLIGLRRRGFSNREISELKSAYNILYNSGLNISHAVEKIKEEGLNNINGHVQNLLDFIAESKRGILRR